MGRRPARRATTSRRRPTTTARRAAASAGMRIDPKSMAPLLDVLFAHDTKLVASALGPPPPHFIERAHGAGIPVAALAGTVEHAARHADAGADLIVAQGTEAGGHTGHDRHDGARARGRRRRRRPSPCSPPAASPAAASSPRAWRSAPTACGAARCGSPPRRPRRRPSVKDKFLARRARRHRALALDHRQAGAHAAHGVDRRVGAARRPRPAADAAAADARRRRHAPHPPRRRRRRARAPTSWSPTSSARWSAA